MYDLTFDKNTEDEVTNMPLSGSGTYVYVSNWKPVRAGATFLGWSFTPDGEVCEWNTAVYHRIDQDTTLYAKWAIKSFTVSYSLNGGKGEVPAAVSYSAETRADITLPTAEGFTKEGRTLVGWYYNKPAYNGTQVDDLSYKSSLPTAKNYYAPGATIPASELSLSYDGTLIAVWKKNEIKVYRDLNDGNGAAYLQSLNYGDVYTLPYISSVPAKAIEVPGLDAEQNPAVGWFCSVDGLVHPTGMLWAGDAAKLVLTEDLTITAVYQYAVVTFMDGGWVTPGRRRRDRIVTIPPPGSMTTTAATG